MFILLGINLFDAFSIVPTHGKIATCFMKRYDLALKNV